MSTSFSSVFPFLQEQCASVSSSPCEGDERTTCEGTAALGGGDVIPGQLGCSRVVGRSSRGTGLRLTAGPRECAACSLAFSFELAPNLHFCFVSLTSKTCREIWGQGERCRAALLLGSGVDTHTPAVPFCPVRSWALCVAQHGHLGASPPSARQAAGAAPSEPRAPDLKRRCLEWHSA